MADPDANQPAGGATAPLPPPSAGLAAYKQGVDAAYTQALTQPKGSGDGSTLDWSTSNALTIGGLVLLFGLIVTGVTSFRMRGATPGQILRLYGTIMAITLACFLVVTGVDNSDIAAGIGFLGTIVGYLLGRSTQPTGPGTADTGGGAGPGGGDGGHQAGGGAGVGAAQGQGVAGG